MRYRIVVDKPTDPRATGVETRPTLLDMDMQGENHSQEIKALFNALQAQHNDKKLLLIHG